MRPGELSGDVGDRVDALVEQLQCRHEVAGCRALVDEGDGLAGDVGEVLLADRAVRRARGVEDAVAEQEPVLVGHRLVLAVGVRVVGEPLRDVLERAEALGLQDQVGTSLVFGLDHLHRAETAGDLGLAGLQGDDHAGVVRRDQGLDLDTEALLEQLGERLGGGDQATGLR